MPGQVFLLLSGPAVGVMDSRSGLEIVESSSDSRRFRYIQLRVDTLGEDMALSLPSYGYNSRALYLGKNHGYLQRNCKFNMHSQKCVILTIQNIRF